MKGKQCSSGCQMQMLMRLEFRALEHPGKMSADSTDLSADAPSEGGKATASALTLSCMHISAKDQFTPKLTCATVQDSTDICSAFEIL